jgi:prepilin-type N-terminal cleavage/methylation domain-containing protein
MRARGFTLIELMVVVGIITILATMSVGMTSDFRLRDHVNASAREIYNGLNRGRAEAIRRGVWVDVEITADRMTAFIDSDGDHAYQTTETMIYQYPTSPEVWSPELALDVSELTTQNVKPVAIFDYQGFSMDTIGQPFAPEMKVSNPALPLERRIEMTIAGAVRIQ